MSGLWQRICNAIKESRRDEMINVLLLNRLNADEVFVA